MAKKLFIIGLFIVLVLNSLSVNLWADAIVTGVNWLAFQLITVSNYSLVVGGTLLLVSFVLLYNDYQLREKKITDKKIKSAKKKKNAKDGMKYEVTA